MNIGEYGTMDVPIDSVPFIRRGIHRMAQFAATVRPSRSSQSNSRSRTRRGRRHRNRRSTCIANGHYRGDGRPTAEWLSLALICNDRQDFDAADQMYRDGE